MPKRPVVASYPLSPMQRGMLLHSLHESGTYIQQLICDLHETLDALSFFQAWQQVSARHDVLRTAFHWEGIVEPLQQVYADVHLTWHYDDWSDLSPVLQDTAFENYISLDRQRGFAVTEAPLMRLAFFKLAADHHRVVWTFHHALLDGRSHFAILEEVFALYEARANGATRELIEPRPYADYIDWLEKQEWSGAEEFWRQRLRGFTPPAELRLGAGPTAPPQRSPNYSSRTIKLSEELTAALKLTAEQNRIALNTMVQASWALLLSRYYGWRDVLFGATRAGRHWTAAGAESIIGLFINTLPLRILVNPQQPLAEWLRDLRSEQIALRKYEHTPLAKIHEWSAAPRGASLFETVLVFENYELNDRIKQLPGNWAGRNFELLEQTHYPLTLAAYSGTALLLKLEYDARRFDSKTAERLLGHVKELLAGMAANLNRRIGQLSMLSGDERRQIIGQWNQTAKSYQRDGCLHKLVQEQVRRSPEAIAVVCANEHISFGELNERANQLAHYLRNRGVGSDTQVGVCLDRSIEMVIALLAVLKAGAAYVPLDLSYPRERLVFILEDAGVKIVLTERSVATDWSSEGVESVYLGNDGEDFSSEPVQEPEARTHADNAAYVIYTSGSTGQPKGVLLTHRAICNHMHWLQEQFPLTEFDRVFQKTPVSFDASVWEFYAPLLAGARLVMARQDGHKDAAYLVQAIRQYEITTLQLVPSLLRALLDDKEFAVCSSLKRVFCGGEPLTRELVERFSVQCAGDLINLYGPTEACIDATFWVLNRHHLPHNIPIGCPIANTTAYILDEEMQPVPIGVSGELYLGGQGLARGYLGQPDLTAARFVPNSFSAEAGARLYRTGDLARYSTDGAIEFLGRMDQQIKLRGFRIELGEIENVLKTHPQVCEVVVLAGENHMGQRTLAAYVVTAPEQPSRAELQSFLGRKLPEYMVPSAFVYLDRLPLTENGKLNVQALPVLTRLNTENAFVAPRDSAEAVIASIWGEVLGLGQLGVFDDFFELGGDSLTATQVVSRIDAAFQIDLPLGSLFDLRTVAALAAAVQDSLIEELSKSS